MGQGSPLENLVVINAHDGFVSPVYIYETEVGERCGEGGEAFEDPARERTAANLNHLVETCGGPLTALVGLCHQAGLDLFPSVRMNSHYDIDSVSPGGGRFRRDHPEFLIGQPGEEFPPGSLEWGVRTGLDYTFPEVRAHMAAVITELFERFDVDGVELDFMRHPAFFRPQEAFANRYLMTDLIRQVRRRMDQASAARSRNLELAVRVPPTLADAARIGLDVGLWIAQGLVDLVIAGGGFIPFETPLEEFVEAARDTDCQVYGCLESLRPALDDEVIWAIASRYWQAGADGIYLFNYFGKTTEWKRRMLPQLADPAALRRRDKRYHPDWTDRLAPRDLHDYAFRYAVPPVQLPVTLAEVLAHRGPILRLGIVDDVEAAQAEGALGPCVLRLNMDHFKGEDEIAVWVNGEVLSSGSSRASFGGWKRLEWTQFPERLSEVAHPGGTLEFDLQAPPLRQGENEIEVRLIRRAIQQSGPVVLRDVELTIAYHPD